MTDVPKELVEVEEEESVVLTCRASGTKPYVVTWFFDGSSSMPLFSKVGYDGSLHIRKLSKSSGGKYTCTVKNAAGSVSHEFRIIVSKYFSRYFSHTTYTNFLKLTSVTGEITQKRL